MNYGVTWAVTGDRGSSLNCLERTYSPFSAAVSVTIHLRKPLSGGRLVQCGALDVQELVNIGTVRFTQDRTLSDGQEPSQVNDSFLASRLATLPLVAASGDTHPKVGTVPDRAPTHFPRCPRTRAVESLDLFEIVQHPRAIEERLRRAVKPEVGEP